jgi:hypothetical protein
MVVKKMFGFLIDDKFVSHEELALEFENLQAKNKKLRQELEIAKSIFREEGFDGAADDIEEALKE